MRSEGNPLDLNNLPDDYNSRDHGKHHQLLDDHSTGGYRKKKSGGGGGNNNNNSNKEECGKVYECRFCSLKFCKSQALGGHMNRHRQERETETLNRARQLVFSNDNLAAQSHLSCCHPITPAGSGYHHPAPAVDPTMPLRFPTRMYSGSPSAYVPPPPPQPPPQPYLYTPPRPFSSHYAPPPPQMNDHYYLGHVLGGSNNPSLNYGSGESNYTCIGAPVGFGRGNTATEMAESGGCDSRDGSLL